jgi:hypothetical protein
MMNQRFTERTAERIAERTLEVRFDGIVTQRVASPGTSMKQLKLVIYPNRKSNSERPLKHFVP